jgi:hypothetical protein
MKQRIQEHLLKIEEIIVAEVNHHGGRAPWSEVMKPLGLLGPCEPNGGQKGYASGFFVERIKEKGKIQIHQSAPRAKKYLVTEMHPSFHETGIRKI